MKSNPSQSDIDSYAAANPGAPSAQATPSILLGSVYGTERVDLKYSKQVASDVAICCLLCVASFIAAYVENLAVEESDSSQQTSMDYSLCIKNPPRTVTDPQEYYDHFKQFGEVVYVSVAKNNGALLQALAQKKVLESELASILALEEHARQKNRTYHTQENLSLFERVLQRTMGMYRTTELVRQELAALLKQIQALSQRDYHPWLVFITFNTEHELRYCLSEISVTRWEAWRQSTANPKAMFKDQVLYATRAHEPSDVSFESSHYTTTQMVLSWVYSYLICLAMSVGCFFVVNALAGNGGFAVAIFISCINAFLPYFMKTVTQSTEIHHWRTNMQQSILFKLVLVRCANSGLLIYLAAKYNEVFALTHLESVQNILIIDAIATPVLRFLDLDGYFYRYVIGYSAISQDELNALWSGNDWTLAERYTDMLKTVFVRSS